MNVQHRGVSIPLSVQVGLEHHPMLLRLLGLASESLSKDARVIGLVLTGSVASATADVFSDIDLLAITTDDGLLAMWNRRAELESLLGTVAFRFDVTEIVPYSAAAYYDDGTKLHVTYRSMPMLRLDAEYRNAIILFAREQGIAEWAAACQRCCSQSDHASLARDDERFWFWLLQGASKVGRGELWAAYDTLHMLRTILVSVICAVTGNAFEGFRRIESRLNEQWLPILEGTVVGVERGSLVDAYWQMLRAYEVVRNQAANAGGPEWVVSAESIDFAKGRLAHWMGTPSDRAVVARSGGEHA